MSDDRTVAADETRALPGEPPAGPLLSWQVAAASWVGLLRHTNQDSALSSARLVAVADGMGGEAAGDLASMVLARRLWLAAGDPSAESFLAAVADAGDDIAELVHADPGLSGMGTTVCGAAFDGHLLDFVHVGDSRAYRLRDGDLTQLTHDHSFVQQLIDQGHLTSDEARVHPRRSLVLRIVNGTSLGRPDHFSEEPRLGDRYLFCSDGLSSFVEHDALRAALGETNLEVAVDCLLEAASRAGAPDNVTLVITQIVAHDGALDTIDPQMWGAAAALKPPQGETSPADEATGIASDLKLWGVDPAAAGRGEDVAPRTAPLRRRRPWTRLAVALVAAAVLAGAVIGARAWLGTQYFLGVVDERAAIFSGVPYKVGPWYLSTVEETSSINLGDLPVYYADQVRTWSIRPDSLAAARQSLATLRAEADACIAARADPAQSPASQDCP